MAERIRTACIATGGRLTMDFLRKHLKKNSYDMVIAVDGALALFDQAGIEPDYIVGDFDTLNPEILKKYAKEKISRHQPEKDQTDTELAIDIAREQGCKELAFIGAVGSRMDHSLANVFLLQQLPEYGINGTIYDETNKLYLRNKSFTLKKSELYGDYLSLIPLTENVTEVTLTGMKYPVEDRIFYRKYTLGVSNEVVDEIAKVSFARGAFLVVESSDEERN